MATNPSPSAATPSECFAVSHVQALISAPAPDHLGMILPHLLCCQNHDTGKKNMLNAAADTGSCQLVPRNGLRRLCPSCDAVEYVIIGLGAHKEQSS